MSSYSNSKKASIKTKIYEGTYSFPTENIIPGTKAVDSLNDVIYYWNGVGWFRLDTEEAAVRTFNLVSNKLSITEGSDVDITLETTNVTDGTLVGYTWYIRTTSGSGTTNTGNFTINDTGGRLITLNIPEDIGTNPELVIELENNKSSLIIPIVPLTIYIDYWRRGGIFLEDGETLTWTVPEGVTSISVAAVGAGNTALEELGEDVAGGGGAIAYSNDISVVPGEIYELRGAQAAWGQSSYIREQGSSDFVVFAEGGFNSRTWEAAGARKGSGGRASASTGDVKYSGLTGRFGTLYGVAGGSAADWDGESIAQDADWSTGRGGYGTNPNGQGQTTANRKFNSNIGASYGGGGGALNPNANFNDISKGWGSGGPGFLKILYPGNTRAFPSTDVNITTEEIYKLTTPLTVSGFEDFEVAVELSRVPSNLNLEVNVTGLPGGTQTKSHVQPSFSINESTTFSFSFTVPEILSDIPVIIDVVRNGAEIISRSVTATPRTKYLLNFSGANLSTENDIVDFIESQGFIATIDGQNITVEDDALNITTAAAINIEYESGDVVIDNTAGTVDLWEIAFYCKTTQTVGTTNGIISSINYNTTAGFGAAMDGIFFGKASGSANNKFSSGVPPNPEWIQGDGQWHHYKIRRRAALNDYYLYRDEAFIGSLDDTYANINLLPFTIGNRYTPLDQSFYSNNFSIADIQINTNNWFTLADYAEYPPDTIFVTNASSGATFYFSGRTLLEILSNEQDPAFALRPYRKYIFDVDLTANTAVTMTFRIDDARGFEEQENIINNSTNLGKITWTPKPGRYNWRAYDRTQGIYAKEITTFFEDLNPKFKELSKDGAGNWNTSYLGGTNGYRFNLTGSSNGVGLYTWYPILQMGSGGIIKNNGQTERVDMLFCQIDTLNSNGQGIGLFNKNLVDTASTYDDVIDAPNNAPIFGQINNYATFDYSGGGNKEHWILIDVSSAALYVFHFTSTLTFAGSWDLTPGDWVLGINKTSTGATPPDFLVRTFSTYWTRDPYDLLFSLNNLRNDGKLGSHYDD